MKKKLFIIALCALALTGCGAKVPKLENGEDAMVTFKDGSSISVNEVWEELKESYGLSTILNTIDLKILKEEYKDKLEEADAYIKNLETSVKSNYVDDNGNYDEDKLLQTLQYYGYASLEAYLDTQYVSYLTDLATTDYAKEQVSEKELNNYYKNNVVGDISAVHILVKPASESDTDIQAAKTKAEEIIKAIKADVKSGTSVKEAFEKYKDDESVTYQDLGYFNKGDMVSEFETAAYALKVNGYSKSPVYTSFGYHVILKTGEKDKEALEDVEDEIRTTLAKDVKENDSAITTKAMVALREKYGVEIQDSEILNRYKQQINYNLNK